MKQPPYDSSCLLALKCTVGINKKFTSCLLWIIIGQFDCWTIRSLIKMWYVVVLFCSFLMRWTYTWKINHLWTKIRNDKWANHWQLSFTLSSIVFRTLEKCVHRKTVAHQLAVNVLTVLIHWDELTDVCENFALKVATCTLQCSRHTVWGRTFDRCSMAYLLIIIS